MAAASRFEGGTHHCAIFPGDEQGATHKGFKNCKLHPEHKEFMTVNEFENKMPSEVSFSGEELSKIRNDIDRTVRVVVSYTSADRPDTFKNSQAPYPCLEQRGFYNWTRYGTAYLVKRYKFNLKEPCSCPECRSSTSQDKETFYFINKTATHVIFDKQEAQNAVFEYFYDSEDRDEVKLVYGVTVLDSDLLRLETDRCFVVCVTHDRSLAEKLDHLWEQIVPFGTDRVLVSHPHGVCKRISVGNFPQATLLMITNKTFVRLKKGMKIRFPGCHDDACVVQDINHLLGKPVICFDVQSKTSVLLCDLFVYRPEGIVVEVDFGDYLEHKVLKRKNKVWWNVYSPGTQLFTDDTFPNKSNGVPGVMIDVFVNIKRFFDCNDLDELCMFTSCRYNMASCPGSSGAHVESSPRYLINSKTGHVHFGDSGNYNTSSLFCVYVPDDKQGSETSDMDMRVTNEYKQLFYEKITGNSEKSRRCWDADLMVRPN